MLSRGHVGKCLIPFEPAVKREPAGQACTLVASMSMGLLWGRSSQDPDKVQPSQAAELGKYVDSKFSALKIDLDSQAQKLRGLRDDMSGLQTFVKDTMSKVATKDDIGRMLRGLLAGKSQKTSPAAWPEICVGLRPFFLPQPPDACILR